VAGKLTRKKRALGPARRPNRRVPSEIAWFPSGEVDVYEDVPVEYGGYNEPVGFTLARSLTRAAFAVKKGLRVVEVHKVRKAECGFQFVLHGKRADSYREDLSRDPSIGDVEDRIENAIWHLVRVLSNAWPREITFRFSDLTVLNAGTED
jgi:hypothetical protein